MVTRVAGVAFFKTEFCSLRDYPARCCKATNHVGVVWMFKREASKERKGRRRLMSVVEAAESKVSAWLT